MILFERNYHTKMEEDHCNTATSELHVLWRVTRSLDVSISSSLKRDSERERESSSVHESNEEVGAILAKLTPEWSISSKPYYKQKQKLI